LKYVLVAMIFSVLFFSIPSQSQVRVSSSPMGPQGDIGFSVGTLTAPSSTSASGNHSPQTIGGGAYLGFSGNFLFRNNLGFGSEVSWRASRNLYQGFQPFRPIFYDFHATYAPNVGQHAQLEFIAGIGGLSTRFYSPFIACDIFACTNYASSNHFMGDVGAGVRFYVYNGIFLRPEFREYFIDNAFEFSSGHASREGVTLGYAFGR
jgi:hypothetical protein